MLLQYKGPTIDEAGQRLSEERYVRICQLAWANVSFYIFTTPPLITNTNILPPFPRPQFAHKHLQHTHNVLQTFVPPPLLSYPHPLHPLPCASTVLHVRFPTTVKTCTLNSLIRTPSLHTESSIGYRTTACWCRSAVTTDMSA